MFHVEEHNEALFSILQMHLKMNTSAYFIFFSSSFLIYANARPSQHTHTQVVPGMWFFLRLPGLYSYAQGLVLIYRV